MHVEGPEPQISGNAKVIIEFRAGEMAQERVQLGGRGYTLVLGDVAIRTGRWQGPITSPAIQSCAEGQALLSCGCLLQTVSSSLMSQISAAWVS